MINFRSPTSTTGSIQMNGNDILKIDANNNIESTNLLQCNELFCNEIANYNYSSSTPIGGVYGVSYSDHHSALAAINSKDVVFIDSGTKVLKAFRLEKHAISALSGTLTITGAGVPALTCLNYTESVSYNKNIVFIDDTLKELRTYRWNGSTFTLLGSGLAITGVNNPAITTLNSTDIAFFDGGNDKLRVYRWNGSNSWGSGYIGSELLISGTSRPTITALNSTDIAFFDSVIGKLRTYRWDGSSWGSGYIGNELIINNTFYPSLSALNSTDVILIDAGTYKFRIYRFDGTDWKQITYGELTDGRISACAITALNSTDILISFGIQDTGDGAEIYLYSYQLGISFDKPYKPFDFI